MIYFNIVKWVDLNQNIINLRRNTEDKLTVFNYYYRKKAFVDSYKENEYFILVISNNDGIVGILPFQKSLKNIEFLGTPRCDYHEIILFKNIGINIKLLFDSLITYLKNYFKNSNILFIDAFYIYGLEGNGENISLIDFKGAPNNSFNLLKYCNRKINFLSKNGIEYCYERIDDKNNIKKFLPILFNIHRKRWGNNLNQFNDKRNIDLYYKLINYLDINNIVFNILYIAGEISAIHFGFLDKNRFYYYKPAYNPLFSKYSPGIILIFYMINDAEKYGCRYFDFLRGNEIYKTKLANRFINNSIIV